jgi:hypothetical protein
MSKLKLKGRIMYPPGPWGATKPVAGAKIRITDIDLPGRTDDVIWQGKTDAAGAFAGTSTEWQDRVRLTPAIRATRITPAVPATYGPDPSDLMLLNIEIAEGEHKLKAPFVFAGNNVLVPMFVNWTPQVESWGKLNGVEFRDFKKLIGKLVATIEKRQPIELELNGEWADAVAPIVALIRKSPLQMVKQVFPASRAGSIEIVVGGTVVVVSTPAIAAVATLVLALGTLVLLSGASAFLVALGIAVILAVANGYANVEASQSTTTDSNGVAVNATTIRLINVAQAPA